MKTIIAPTDFSPISVNAVNFAADMAVALDASLLLFNVYNIPVPYGEVPVALVSVDEIKKSSEAELEVLKRDIMHVASGKLKVYTESIMGNTVDELEELCKKVKPLAVVMGAKGTSGLETILFGSTTLTAIRHLTWPVICVPPGKEYGNGIKKIGFACDFKQVAETIPVEPIKEMVKEFHAELHIINVDHDDKHFKPDTPEESWQLHDMFTDLNPQYHFIDHPDVEEGINKFAEENNLDLIIAIPKKHKLLEGLFSKRNTKKLVFHSHIPVMCVHEE
ncbi:MAG: universal stress protein [Chitinophagaceae bacterium]|nr:universal stress protein [Chitinophagaceae bacterium]